MYVLYANTLRGKLRSRANNSLTTTNEPSKQAMTAGDEEAISPRRRVVVLVCSLLST